MMEGVDVHGRVFMCDGGCCCVMEVLLCDAACWYVMAGVGV